MSKVQSGQAFEYGILLGIAEAIRAEIIRDKQLDNAANYFDKCEVDEQKKIIEAGKVAASFLAEQDNRLIYSRCKIGFLSSQEGVRGDVRDIIVWTPKGEVGISAKNRHFAVKHSRLSEKIDFGQEWLGVPVSDNFRHEVRSIFQELAKIKKSGKLWREIEDKEERFYVPILNAFNRELKKIYALHQNGNNISSNLLRYLLGRYDYYKVIKSNGVVSVRSFNIEGTLKWGNKLPLPQKLISTDMKSGTTLLVNLDKGWQLSFRIHNASRIVEPSLKFDVQLVGVPANLTHHEINYLQ